MSTAISISDDSRTRLEQLRTSEMDTMDQLISRLLDSTHTKRMDPLIEGIRLSAQQATLEAKCTEDLDLIVEAVNEAADECFRVLCRWVSARR